MAEWLSLPATASELGVSAETVRKMILAGRLPATRVNDRLKVQKPDIDKFIAENRVMPEPPEAA